MHISSIEHEGQKKVGKPRTIELQKARPCLIILILSQFILNYWDKMWIN